MLTDNQPRAGDVRVLAGAVSLGSFLGLAIGAAYLLGVAGRFTSFPAQGGAAPATYAASQAAQSVAATGVPDPHAIGPSGWSGLRSRFRIDPLPLVAARPFRMARVDGDSDLTCLTQVVYYEARGEPAAGQAAVAQVVLNRVRHPAFPKTICGVAHQRSEAGCQFTFACKNLADDRIDPDAWRRARRIAFLAMHGSVMSGVGEATHFQTLRSDAFSGLLKVAQIGAHAFYRFAGAKGAADMFHQAPAPSQAASAVTTAGKPAAEIQLAKLTNGAPPVETAPAYKVIDASAAVTVEHTALPPPSAKPEPPKPEPIAAKTAQAVVVGTPAA